MPQYPECHSGSQPCHRIAAQVALPGTLSYSFKVKTQHHYACQSPHVRHTLLLLLAICSVGWQEIGWCFLPALWEIIDQNLQVSCNLYLPARFGEATFHWSLLSFISHQSCSQFLHSLLPPGLNDHRSLAKL